MSIFYTKFVSMELILWELISPAWQVKCLRNRSPDSVGSGRTCLANLGVRSCLVRKLICPVQLSPNPNICQYSLINNLALEVSDRMERQFPDPGLGDTEEELTIQEEDLFELKLFDVRIKKIGRVSCFSNTLNESALQLS